MERNKENNVESVSQALVDEFLDDNAIEALDDVFMGFR